jgi:two-component system heavy metal sensor histidine kinase CusS
MKSIRLSLMVYFLALLAVALLASSLLVYRNAVEYRDAEEKAKEQLIEAQYQRRCRDVEHQLDQALLTQAQTLARLVYVQFDWSRGPLQPLFLMGLIGLGENAHVLAPTWIAEGWPSQRPRPPQRSGSSPASDRPPPPESPSPVWIEFQNRFMRDVKLKEEVFLPGESQASNYFQIDLPPGKPYSSRSMSGHTPFEIPRFPSEQLAPWVYDDVDLDAHTRVRRVVLKASSVDMVRWGRSRGSAGRGAQAPMPPPFHVPDIYLHCAAETNKRDAALAELRDRRDEELAAVAKQTDDSLRDLRKWLWGISLSVFTATAAGTFWLVRLGLSPLRRLSHAVSKVSVKDFRLPLDGRPLPLELRPIAGRLATTLDLLKRTFAREKQAVADISHELRTPLAALLTTTELALRKPRSPEHYRELLGDVHASAQQMNQIVERLLTLARLDAGVDRLRVQMVDVGALAQQCADVVRPLADARGLKLTVKNGSAAANGDGCRVVQTDPDKLREIVSNLLHNAIQYNRPGGAIDLSVARANGTLEVQVQDTGIGIAAEAKERIFERFYRADPSRGGDDLHAGLGLAIVKEYIDLMGGSIGVESTEGQGSTFRVLLPVR